MRLLIVYNTRTNFTKKIAQELAKKLSADTEELVDLKKRTGPLGYFTAGKDAAGKRLTKLEPLRKNIYEYDLIIIGTPVWVGTMTPAIRTFLEAQKHNIKRFVCFSTQGSSSRQKVFDEINKVMGRNSEVNTFFPTKEVAQEKYSEKLEEFVRRIQALH